MFGLIDALTDTVEDVIDIGVGVATLGAYGDISRTKVSSLIASGLTVYEITEMTGWSIDLIEELTSDS